MFILLNLPCSFPSKFGWKHYLQIGTFLIEFIPVVGLAHSDWTEESSCLENGSKPREQSAGSHQRFGEQDLNNFKPEKTDKLDHFKIGCCSLCALKRSGNKLQRFTIKTVIKTM